MSLPTTAPAEHAASSTDARQVSIESGTSNRSCNAAIAGTTRSSSSASPTSGPGPAFTPPTSRRSAPGGDELLGSAEERVEVPGRAAVVERVGCAVEDAHHERTGADVVVVRAEADRRKRRRHAAEARPARSEPRRTTVEHQANRRAGPRDRADPRDQGGRRLLEQRRERRCDAARPRSRACRRRRPLRRPAPRAGSRPA